MSSVPKRFTDFEKNQFVSLDETKEALKRNYTSAEEYKKIITHAIELISTSQFSPGAVFKTSDRTDKVEATESRWECPEEDHGGGSSIILGSFGNASSVAEGPAGAPEPVPQNQTTF